MPRDGAGATRERTPPAAQPGRAPRVLYLSYTGLLEPLGQSQVLAYLAKLAPGRELTLLSFERAGDLADGARLAAMRQACAAANIRWRYARYRARPRLVAPLGSLLQLAWMALREAREGRADLVHARGYIPAFAAWLLRALGGPPFIFDTRALWLDELVASGRLRGGGAAHRLLRLAERRCLRDAGAVVSLTEAAVPHLQQLAGRPRDVVVVPTCVSLDRFAPQPRPASPRAIGWVGSVLSGWFDVAALHAFLAAAARRWPEARFHIVTRDDAASVRAALGPARLPDARLLVYAAPFAEIPAVMAGLDAGVMLYRGGLAKLNTCPTRMGEHLAAGTPVVASRGVGDVAALVEGHRIGALMEDASEGSAEAACDQLAALLQDPGTAARCRQAAEAWFSLAGGVAVYDRLYRTLAAP